MTPSSPRDRTPPDRKGAGAPSPRHHRPRRVRWLGGIHYERLHEPLLPGRLFLGRMARSGVTAFALIGASLLIGMVGYHTLSHLSWVDSLLNASMILTGMGPVDRMESNAAKIFASAYALFSGVAFLTIVGLLMAPVVHRFLHRFHLETDEGNSEGAKPQN
jgi:hypothetical protein